MRYLLSGDAAEGVLYIEGDSLRPSFCTGVRPKCNLAIFEAWILLSSSLCIAVIIVPRWRPACIYRSSFGIRTRRKAYRSRYSLLCAEPRISLGLRRHTGESLSRCWPVDLTASITSSLVICPMGLVFCVGSSGGGRTPRRPRAQLVHQPDPLLRAWRRACRAPGHSPARTAVRGRRGRGGAPQRPASRSASSRARATSVLPLAFSGAARGPCRRGTCSAGRREGLRKPRTLRPHCASVRGSS